MHLNSCPCSSKIIHKTDVGIAIALYVKSEFHTVYVLLPHPKIHIFLKFGYID